MLQVLIIVWVFSASTGNAEWTKQTIVDLTHDFDMDTIYWPGGGNFQLDEVFIGQRGDYWYEANRLSAPEHGGTHLDAPVHFYKGKWHVTQIPVENFVAPAVVIDISARAIMDPDTQLLQQDIIDWENKHGGIPAGAIVFMNSDWSKKWPSKEAHFGSATYNDTTTFHFPGFHPNTTQWLVDNRDIVGIGVDTASVDHGQSTDFLTHQIIGKANVYGLENVANLHLLPPAGATIVALPMKIKSGSGAPCHIIAFLPDTTTNAAASCYRFPTLAAVLAVLAHIFGNLNL